LTLAGCGNPDGKPDGQPDGKPEVRDLQESFDRQISGISSVRDFQRKGDELTFSATDGTGSQAKWRVHIDSAAIEANDDEKKPYKGIIKSSWYANDRLIPLPTSRPTLPREVLEKGISQESWAFWEKSTRQWDW
jgi:hypothetical protein